MDIVVLLDDDLVIREGFQQQFEFLELNLELMACSNYEEYEAIIGDKDQKKRVRCFIMDLSNTASEQVSHSFKASDYIDEQYNKNRVPIFVHSAYLDFYEDLSDKGTVFKIPKDRYSTEKICKNIKLMKDSGFIDVFCPDGSLEKKIMSEIHLAFVEQFKSNEIEKIIESVKSSEPAKIQERTVEIFERIALRSVYQNFINNPLSSESIKVNAIEHYYRRKGMSFFTGDIFKNRDTEQLVFIATPRCNVANKKYEEILLCKVSKIDEDENQGLLKKIDNLRKIVTDDVTNSLIGERRRFLPQTPQFQGGFVDFNFIFSISQNEFDGNYEYQISLVDDLTNDVIRKLTTYLQRGGISDTNYLEAQHYMKKPNLEDEALNKK